MAERSSVRQQQHHRHALLSSSPTTRQRRLRRLRETLDEYHALVVFGRLFNAGVKRERDEALQGLEAFTNRELDHFEKKFSQHVADLRKLLGARRPTADYVSILRRLQPHQTEYVFFPKWLLKFLFRNAEQVWPGLADLPEHARLSFDVGGNFAKERQGEIRILEAALFEDVCAMFNLAWEMTPRCQVPTATKRDIKTAAAARRATVSAAFYFVEAYLNSLAFDHVANHEAELDADTLSKLTEWDFDAGRERFVSFRFKLLHYPRIVANATHPLLQETNCPPMAYLLDEAKLFRDSIVHANARPDPNTLEFDKEHAFWLVGSVTPLIRTTDDEADERSTRRWIDVVDNAIGVVRSIEAALGRKTERLFWLVNRPESGPFPDTVFD